MSLAWDETLKCCTPKLTMYASFPLFLTSPGSALLDDHDVGAVPDAVVSHLKKGTGRFSHIVLQPQPSDDPRDPLNWPRWKKEGLFWVLTYMAGLVGAIGPLISTGYATLAPQLGVSETALVQATNSDLILALGCIMIFFAPIAVKVGRRPCYLIGAACLFFASIGAAATTSFTGLKIARIFQGFGMAPYEALVVSSIGDVFFAHERGVRTAIWSFAIGGGIGKCSGRGCSSHPCGTLTCCLINVPQR